MPHYSRKVSNETASQAARRAIILGMKHGRIYTSGDLARMCGRTERAAAFQAKKLADMGLLERPGQIKGVEVFALAPAKAEVTA